MSRRFVFASLLLACASASSVARADPLTDEERTQRCADIRDVAADNGISAGYLFAGIAQAETNLSHCWEELDWACQGPASVDCGGGPVVAGAGDGPCELQEGGLGMFQFDGGTFDETMARDGDGVLLLSGNVTRAVDFVVNMVMASVYVDAPHATPDEAKAWMNSVVVDGPGWTEWVQTVTHYYNGCTPSGCGVYDQRFEHYWDAGVSVYFEQGEDFWVVDIPPCGTIPPEGRLLEETDTCFTKGGPLPYWRVGIGGESNLHVWTGTTDLEEAVNYAEWTLDVEEAGEYLVEVSVAGGTTPQAHYLVDHDGTTSDIVVDQSAGEGFVELGILPFAAGSGQRVFVGDNTGDLDERRLGVDAIRLTRIGGEGGGSGGSGEGGVETTSSLLASSGAAGDGGSSPGDEGVGVGGRGGDGSGEGGSGDAAADGGEASGCDCATRPGAPVHGAWALALVGAALGLARRRRLEVA